MVSPSPLGSACLWALIATLAAAPARADDVTDSNEAHEPDGPPDGSERKTIVRPPPSTPATSVLDADRLTEKAGADLPMALSGEPGVHVPRLGGLGSYATLSIRGSTPEQVLVTLDGIPLNPADGAPVDLSTLPVGPLSHVAIHRGRAPWSLGLGGLGGALRLETRKQRGATLSGEIGGGSFSTRFLRAHGGVEGFSLSLEHLGTASDFRYRDDGGTAWTTADDRTVTRQNAASAQTSALARGDFTVGDFEVTLIDTFTHIERGLPSLGVTPTRESALTLTRNLFGLRAVGLLGPLSMSVTGAFATAATTVEDPRHEIGLAGDEHTTRSHVPHGVVTLGLPLGDLYLATHLALRHEIADGPESVARTVGSTALEAQLRHDTLSVAAGLRLERGPELFAPSAFAEVALTIIPRDGPGNGAGGTIDAIRLHLALHHTPRLPSLFERYGNLGLVLGNPDLTSESLTQLELGLRLELGDDDWRAHLVLLGHGGIATDLIQYLQNAQGITRPENIASARIFGLELAAELALGDHLTVRSSLGLLDARDTSDIAARTGKRLPLRPSFTTAHRVEVRLPEPDLGPERGALGLAIDLDHVSGNALDAANLVQARPRTLIGASAFVRSDRVEVRASLMNLTSSAVSDLVGYPLPGLTALVALRWLTP